MIKHMALFTLKKSQDGMDKGEMARRISRNVGGLRDAIPSIRHIEVGGPFEVSGVSFPQSDVAVYVEFDSEADYKAYFNHPLHKAAAAFAASVSERVSGITYVV